MNYDIGYFDEIDYKFAPNESAFGDQLKTLTLKREEITKLVVWVDFLSIKILLAI
ncbi:MAG: hypothetical protein HQK52_21140 [Oligoflexia bacterium]|nr:hypothetical protein [Oligoflexia bacterium]